MKNLPPSSSSRRGLVLAALGAAALAATACQKAAPAFAGIDLTGADYGRDFSLQDPDGRTRTMADFRGKAVMLFFGFTQCPDACPTALARAAEVRRLLGPQGERLQVIFITIDPERDSAAVLKEYTHAFDPSFLGLRADADGTAAVAKEFKVIYRKVPTGSSYTMDHTAFTYVLDPQGRLRLAMRHELSAQDVARDVSTLLAQAG